MGRAPALAAAGFPKYNYPVKSALRVASPPAKPLLVFDGECAFCLRWIRRCQRRTGDHVEYLAFQDPQVATRFPEIPKPLFAAAVQLIRPDGTVCGGAEAVFQTLAFSRWRPLLKWYRRSPRFARLAERSYGFVARHRAFFSWLP
jgi:lipase maturation factor 1